MISDPGGRGLRPARRGLCDLIAGSKRCEPRWHEVPGVVDVDDFVERRAPRLEFLVRHAEGRAERADRRPVAAGRRPRRRGGEPAAACICAAASACRSDILLRLPRAARSSARACGQLIQDPGRRSWCPCARSAAFHRGQRPASPSTTRTCDGWPSSSARWPGGAR